MRDRELSKTFDTVASKYHAARPDYPEQLFADLLQITGVDPGARLLEVGCGTGKATIPLAHRGFEITALERGTDLAEQARVNLHGVSNVQVLQTSFEDWEPLAPVDLVYAATSWHWIDPAVSYAKAAAFLHSGGHLAVWGAGHALPADADPFFGEIQPVYAEIGHTRPGTWPPPPPEQAPDLAEEFDASGYFEVVAVRRYVWSLRYTAAEYVALLDTFSDHIAMEPASRTYLDAEIRRLLADRPDGALTRHWVAVSTIGRRR